MRYSEISRVIMESITYSDGAVTVKFSGSNGSSAEKNIYSIDFKTKTIKYNNRKIKRNIMLYLWRNATVTLNEVIPSGTFDLIFLRGFADLRQDELKEEHINAIETYYIYKDKYVDNVLLFPFMPNGVPKGYTKYLDDNNLKMTKETYTDFKSFGHLSGLSKQKITFIKNIFDYLECSTDFRTRFTKEHMDVIDKLNKICINTTKNGTLRQFEGLREIVLEKDYEEFLPSLDTSKDIEDNYKLIKGLYEAKKYAGMADKLQTLNFLNGKRIGEYTVVIPQNVGDLVNEGEAQHNCVGSYYNQSIMDGHNLILFLRKSDNVEKSYMTLRYSKRENSITEYRLARNEAVTDDNELTIVEMLSQIIRKHFNK